jgi:hypothetical protein
MRTAKEMAVPLAVPQNCPKNFPKLSQTCPKIVLNCLNFQNVSQTCLKLVSAFKTCLKLVSNVSQTCLNFQRLVSTFKKCLNFQTPGSDSIEPVFMENSISSDDSFVFCWFSISWKINIQQINTKKMKRKGHWKTRKTNIPHKGRTCN